MGSNNNNKHDNAWAAYKDLQIQQIDLFQLKSIGRNKINGIYLTA